DRLADPADRRRHHGNPCALRLDHRETEAFVQRREGEDIEAREQLRYIVALAGKLEGEPPGPPLQFGTQRPVADDDEARVREPLEDRGGRLDEGTLILLLDEPRDVADHASVVRASRNAEAAEVQSEWDDDAVAAVAPTIRFRRVDHERPRQPAET